MVKIFAVISLFLFVFTSCEKSEKQLEIGKEEGVDAEKTIEDKRAKGDTLELPAYNLLAYLPTSFDGYNQVGEPVLENKKEGQFSWSSVFKTLVKGKDTIKITLADYNRAYGLFAGATAFISPENKMNNSEEDSEVVTINGKWNAWVSYKKHTHEASLIMGIADRFLISIEAQNQNNNEYIQSVVDKINTEELSKY